MSIQFQLILLMTSVLQQAAINILRVTTSYRAIEVNIPAGWLALIIASFSLIPILIAMPIGSYIDRGNDARMTRFGGLMLTLGAAGFLIDDSITAMLLSMIVLGIGNLSLTISIQILCARDKRPEAMARMVSNYLLANAVGQGLGPYIVGLVGGASVIPPTHTLYWIGLVLSAAVFVCAFGLGPDEQAASVATPDAKTESFRDIMRSPGYLGLFALGVSGTVAQELLAIYLPLLAAARGISSGDAGQMLVLRAGASLAARVVFARMYRKLGPWPLALSSAVVAAAAYAAIALPVHIAFLYGFVTAAGFALSTALATSLTAQLGLMSPASRGRNNAIRTMGARIGVFVVPFVASSLAVIAGAGGVFVLIGVGLGLSAALVKAGLQSNASG